MSDEYTFEKFKRFVELLGDQHPYYRYFMGMLKTWEKERNNEKE